MSFPDLTPKRIDIETYIRWCTDKSITRNSEDWAAYNIVQILKGNAFNGYFYFNMGTHSRSINQNNSYICLDEIVRRCAERITKIHPLGATIVPVPNSNGTLGSPRFRTLDLARAVKAHLSDSYRAKPILVWRQPQKKSSKGERSRNWRQHLENLEVYESTNKPVILFDDVVTTGSQLYASKLKLERSGFRVAKLIAVASVLGHDGVTHSSEPEWETHYRTFYS